LLMNAIEAMPHGGKLAISAIHQQENVLLSVRDSGPGIPDEIKDKIFEPFFSTKNDNKGVGLGLAVVYGIVQRHRGKIWVETPPSGGTTFQILLPLQQEKSVSNTVVET
ncbi:MAG: ATP-binding protein, partial [Calditrichaeota bacterium]|nr:ATP-binding protein [Calditrichota bacterium]